MNVFPENLDRYAVGKLHNPKLNEKPRSIGDRGSNEAIQQLKIKFKELVKKLKQCDSDIIHSRNSWHNPKGTEKTRENLEIRLV